MLKLPDAAVNAQSVSSLKGSRSLLKIGGRSKTMPANEDAAGGVQSPKTTINISNVTFQNADSDADSDGPEEADC